METQTIRPATAAATTPDALVPYTIDPAHAHAGFRVRHLMVAHVRGELGPVRGEVHLDPDEPARSRSGRAQEALQANAVAAIDDFGNRCRKEPPGAGQNAEAAPGRLGQGRLQVAMREQARRPERRRLRSGGRTAVH